MSVLHEIFFQGVVKEVEIPNQLQCKGSTPKSFDEFDSARIAMDVTEAIQDIDVPSDMKNQTLSYISCATKSVKQEFV